MELQQLEATPPQAPVPGAPSENADQVDPNSPPVKQQDAIDPEQVKAGLRKAIELAPQAVSAMESAIESLHRKDWQQAGVAAEEARRILEEIQKAQPKNEQKPNEQPQDQNDNKQKNENDNQSKDSQSDDKKEEKDKRANSKTSQKTKTSQKMETNQKRKRMELRTRRSRKSLKIEWLKR